ncbi:hypothetical protein SCHPADRAFT_896397 [Schizopora paradoxa]|uniref:Uncharacterized protein n=1 Tax=Schizopora paradoxa TaxID=27342 RepID=A0A0H2R6Z7_9AGAM|nr:hypothetical protein SCHPADRAFT_896397 [Schizopora paradoxa]
MSTQFAGRKTPFRDGKRDLVILRLASSSSLWASGCEVGGQGRVVVSMSILGTDDDGRGFSMGRGLEHLADNIMIRNILMDVVGAMKCIAIEMERTITHDGTSSSSTTNTPKRLPQPSPPQLAGVLASNTCVASSPSPKAQRVIQTSE